MYPTRWRAARGCLRRERGGDGEPPAQPAGAGVRRVARGVLTTGQPDLGLGLARGAAGAGVVAAAAAGLAGGVVAGLASDADARVAAHVRASATVTPDGPSPVASTVVPSAVSVPAQTPLGLRVSVICVPDGSCLNASPFFGRVDAIRCASTSLATQAGHRV